jgi:hypothetical protein
LVTRGRIALAVAVGLVAVVGCGGETKSDRDRVIDVVREFRIAVEDGDGRAACALLTARGQRFLLQVPRGNGRTCEQALSRESSASGVRKAEDEKVLAEVDGEEADAWVRVSPYATSVFQLRKVAGRWKIDTALSEVSSDDGPGAGS